MYTQEKMAYRRGYRRPREDSVDIVRIEQKRIRAPVRIGNVG